jgi:hypothetical protein
MLGEHGRITTTERDMNARANSLAESMRQARERGAKGLEDAIKENVQVPRLPEGRPYQEPPAGLWRVSQFAISRKTSRRCSHAEGKCPDPGYVTIRVVLPCAASASKNSRP